VAHTAVEEQTRDRLGKYRLIAMLARGGMGDVYLAAADGVAGFNKLLVIKELRPEQADDDFYVNLFMDEARLAARLNHPNIVQAIEVGTEGLRRFLVMEHLDGQPLHRVLRRARRVGQPLAMGLSLRMLADVLEALAYAHALTEFDGSLLGIVHRDVSPQNVFLTYEGQVKLIDFGIAKTRLSSQQTHAGVIKGKIRYMAPEQATGKAVDGRADVFSVGVMLWDFLVGHGPWEGHDDVRVLRALLAGAIPRLRDQRQDLPAGLVAVVDRAMCAAPEDRYPTARAMRDELLQFVPPSRGGNYVDELREVVSRLFAAERRELGIAIDAQLRSVSVAAPLQLVSLTRVRSLTYDGTSDLGRERSSRGNVPVASRAGGAEDAPSPAPISAWSRPRLVAAFAGVALVTVGAIGGLHAARMAHPQVTPSGASAPVATPAAFGASPPPSAATSAAGPSRVTIHSSPSPTRLYVDGVYVGNAYSAELIRSDVIHTVLAEAAGYIAKSVSFTAEADRDLVIALEREPVRTHGAVRGPVEAPVRAAASSVAPSTATSTDVRSSRVRRQRDIDKEDPYAP
jgi:eukaryotic-like serine/threonine-protein kinase